jgi:hypothetical protein
VREEQRYSKPKIFKEEGLLFMIFFEALRYSLLRVAHPRGARASPAYPKGAGR